MFSRIRQLLELIRFSHTLFALPFALLAAAMAWAANRHDAARYALSLARPVRNPVCMAPPAAPPWPSIAWPTGGSTP